MSHARSSSPVALVTTVWLASQRSAHAADSEGEGATRHADVLSAFLLYHVHIGVAKIFVFFDGDEHSQLRIDELHPQVQALHAVGRIELRYTSPFSNNGGDANDLNAQYERYCANFSKFRDVVHQDVAARQMLNAELAMRLCLQHNQGEEKLDIDSSNERHQQQQRIESEKATIGELRWLLHLDVDELLHLDAFTSSNKEPSQALREYVANLETQQHAHQMTLLNYEAIPTQLHGGNYFTSATKFRKHHARIPFSSQAQRGIAFWQQRTTHSQFFLFYDNGKSIVRVMDKVIPASVHHWQVTSDSLHSASKSNFYDARRNFAQEDVVHEPVGQRACILHYPVCGLEWLCEKYERLGEFPDVWGGTGGDKEMKIPPCFHTQARDALMECQKIKKKKSEPEALEELYKSHVMLDVGSVNTREWRVQVDAGVCEEIQFVAQVLAPFGFSSSSRVDDTQCDSASAAATVGEQENNSGGAADSKPRSSVPQTPATAGTTTEFTTEKAWMLASISQQYL